MSDISFEKDSIRAILLSLGKCATEREFRKAYFELNGESFNDLLRRVGMNFVTFFAHIPDVAKMHIDHINRTVVLTRVAASGSSHMDSMTVNKYSKNYKGPKLNLGAYNTPTFVQSSAFNQINPLMRVSFNWPPGQRHFLRAPVKNLSNPIQYHHGHAPTNSARMIQPQHLMFHPPALANFPLNRPLSPAAAAARSTLMPQTFNAAPSRKDLKPVIAQQRPSASSGSSSVQHRLAAAQRLPLLSTLPQNQPKSSNPFLQNVQPPARPNPFDTTPRPDKHQGLIDWDSASTCSSSSVSSVSLPTKTIRSRSPSPQFKEPLHNITLAMNNTSIQSVVPPPPSSSTAITTTDKRGVPVQLKERLSSLRMLQKAFSKQNEATVARDFPWTMPEYKYGKKAFFDIKIYDVVSPSRFTFQFGVDKLEDMMKRMNNFYDNLRSELLQQYKVQHVKLNMIVAVCRTGSEHKYRWYRAEIVEANAENLSVRYIDYYKVTKQLHYVSLNEEVYHLEKEFSDESPKSAYGRLHGIKPISSDWCLESKLDVIDSRGDVMMATIKKYANGVFALTVLINPIDFNRLNDCLIRKKYAQNDVDDYQHLAPIEQRSLV